ncbi:hypothetical protein QA645_40365 [Bradyrhizobium sp. CIAT3101]|uniref:hypothetical protein n=1 Tax=Bradyrhizobium sp. CIAT3101 TaxID=439387 RepID=UPI0024B04EEB|nr:hypothetical protein [Bradyrhizobium sp. CIAT3101]WFU80627.1 hypothetical protein QA645_40365 [Bradyrhizobium sp. CIAT3101]
MELIPSDYREAYPGLSAAALKKQLSRFFAENAIILPHSAAASISTPMTRSDIQFFIDVFAGFLDSHQEMLDTIEASR